MRLGIIAVGTRMPEWVRQGVDEFCKRLPREFHFTWREIAPARRGKDTAGAQASVAEGEQILQNSGRNSVAVGQLVATKNLPKCREMPSPSIRIGSMRSQRPPPLFQTY